MKKGQAVDMQHLIPLGAGFPVGKTAEFYEFTRCKVRPKFEDLFGNQYVIIGKKKGREQAYLIDSFDDHDKAFEAMKKLVGRIYKSEAMEFVLP